MEESSIVDLDKDARNSLSIQDLISYLKSSFRARDFDAVEAILTSRDMESRCEKEKLKTALDKKTAEYEKILQKNGDLALEKCILQHEVNFFKQVKCETVLKSPGKSENADCFGDKNRINVLEREKKELEANFESLTIKFNELRARIVRLEGDAESLKKNTANVNRLIVDIDIEQSSEKVVSNPHLNNQRGGEKLKCSGVDNRCVVEVIDSDEEEPIVFPSWMHEAEMINNIKNDPQICLECVCALHRQKLLEVKTLLENGFSEDFAVRGARVGKFLLDGDGIGRLMKSVVELEKFEAGGLALCKELATWFSRQLFEIYCSRQDPLFHR